MSLTSKFCDSPELRKKEQGLCYQFADDCMEILKDLEKKGYLRSELPVKKEEEGRMRSFDVLLNVRKVTKAFNMFFGMYAEKVKPDSKQRLKKFLELNKPYGLTEEDLRYLLYSEMIFVFLQNVEEFRFALLFILKLPIRYSFKGKKKKITNKTTLGKLLKSLEELEIKKADTLKRIDYNLRNGLSHCLFWFHEKGDLDNPKPHVHYSEDMTFKKIHCKGIDDLYIEMRKQSIYTNCLLNVIGDWFF